MFGASGAFGTDNWRFLDLVQVRTDKAFGSGLLVAPGIVLTAFHCVADPADSWAIYETITVNLWRELTGFGGAQPRAKGYVAKVIWQPKIENGKNPPDVALLELLTKSDKPVPLPKRMGPLLYADLGMSDSDVVATGFPAILRAGHLPGGRSEGAFSGKANLCQLSPPTISFTATRIKSEESWEAWSGLSGGPLFRGDAVVAIMRGGHPKFKVDRNLEAEPLAPLLRDHDGLARLLGPAKAVVAGNWETEPQPKLELFKASRTDDAQIRLTDLQFKRRATSYLSRPVLDTKVIPWLQSNDRFGILKVTGAAGMGKSRLALELCDRFHHDNWLAGFVDAKQDWPDPWEPSSDTLVVLDYAASKRFGDRTAFEWLQSIYMHTRQPPKPNQPATRVRIVLLDRTERGPLWSDWKASEIALDLDERALAVELTPDRVEFDAIVIAELKRRQRAPTEADRKAIAAVAERLRGQFRPLFALLTAAALAEGKLTASTIWSPELLVESILKSQRHQWETAGLTDEHLDLLFEATLTQGACGDDPEFSKRVQALDQVTLDALTTLSEQTSCTVADIPVGSIAPDLLGEFFVLMRLRGDLQMHLKRQTASGQKIGRAILRRSWGSETAEAFLGRLLEDLLAWEPRTGANPALEIMSHAFAQIESGRASPGLQTCCFATAWKRPADRDWSAWLEQVPTVARSEVVAALSMGLYNATVGEPDPAKRLALAERIEVVHTQHGEEAAVREFLARALCNVTVGEPEPAKCLALAERIEALHTQYGEEVAVREPLARALYSATEIEPDPAKCLALAERIELLHTQHGEEAAVREFLARALCNVTVGEPEPAKCLALAERIGALHTQYGEEVAVRESLARALYSATVDEPDPAKCLALAERIEALHTQHGSETVVREQLAGALYNATVVETDPVKRLALADRIEVLHTQHGEEAAVREQLACALGNATEVEPDPAKRLALAERIEALHTQYGEEAAVREEVD